jgi:ParB family chromosome partitioning protein
MSEKRRGLGRGLGALIPSSATVNASGNGSAASRPVDLFFPEGRKKVSAVEDNSVRSAPAENPAVADPSSDGSSTVNERTTSTTHPAPRKTAAKAAAPSTKDGEVADGKVPAKPRVAVNGSLKPVEHDSGDDSSAPISEDAAQADNGVDLVEVPGARFAEIPVGDIHPNRKQPRSVFDEDDMAELIHSVREIGVLQPIVVRTSTESGGEPYELVMGERRWRAVQAAGLETIPAIVRDTTDDDLLRDALLENLHRSQLNPLEGQRRTSSYLKTLVQPMSSSPTRLAAPVPRSRIHCDC